jgi:hypothetical protein
LQEKNNRTDEKENIMRKIPFQFSHGGYIRQEVVQSAVSASGLESIDVETEFNHHYWDLA